MAINFVTVDDVRILRDIEQYYSTREKLKRLNVWMKELIVSLEIDEMPMNVAELT